MKKLLLSLGLALIASVGLADCSGTVVNIEYSHEKVHDGDYYLGSAVSGLLASGVSFNILISPNASEELHLRPIVKSNVSVNIALYDTPTTPSAGTAMVLYNMYPKSGKTLSTVASSNVAVTTLGTVRIPVTQIPPSNVNSSFNTPEIILDPSKRYLLSVIMGAAGYVSIDLGIYKNN